MDRYRWTNKHIVDERLQSHLIPIHELANGGYENLSDAQKATKLSYDFDAFLRQRANLVIDAAQLLASGHQIGPIDLYDRSQAPHNASEKLAHNIDENQQ